MFAIIGFRGKQIKVTEEKEYKLPFYECKVGDKFIPESILLISDGKDIFVDGKRLEGGKIEGVVTEIGQDKKISVVKFHSKKRYQRFAGHRQDFVKVKIDKLSV